ncbi:putative membrane protein YfcA [Candidatus Methanophagaceae archaeon]|nr:putative membrane protein YfcA [Methanophagales archaeon]
MEIIKLIKVGLVLFSGGFIQSSAGFGFGLFALPILLFLELPFPEAVMIIIIGSAFQKIIGIRYFRTAINWKEIRPLILAGLIALPAGIFFMRKVSGLNQHYIKLIIGILILIMLFLRWSRVSGKKGVVRKEWGFVTGFLSGLLNGFANIGGPPVVLWVLSHNWDNKKMRATIIAISMFFVPFQISIMLVLFGASVLNAMIYAFFLSPFVLSGSWAGLKAGDRISKNKLKVYMEFLLFIIAISSIIKPFI